MKLRRISSALVASLASLASSPSRAAVVSLASLAALAGGALGLAAACGPSGFQSSTVIDSVRVLATRVDNDKSYALPGDVVTLETLAVDGRTTPTPPAVTYWIPYVCTNPFDDLYYGCFAPLLGGDAGAGDAGPDGGGNAGAALAMLFQAGIDITAGLPQGSYTFTVPEDIIATHPPVAGAAPYGLVILFNIVCAGRVWTTPINPGGGPEQVPIVCADEKGNALSPDQYVIGYSRVYVSATKTNANPRIAGFFLNGTEIDAGGASDPGIPSPITLPPMKACHGGCKAVSLDLDVPASSWAPGTKSIWVDYYAKGGNVGGEARLLYDISAGRTPDTGHEIQYTPPDDPGPATIFAVVHDSNDGVTWLQVNVTATK